MFLKQVGRKYALDESEDEEPPQRQQPNYEFLRAAGRERMNRKREEKKAQKE